MPLKDGNQPGLWNSYLSSDTELINFCTSPQVLGGWLNLEFSQGEKHFRWDIRTI